MADYRVPVLENFEWQRAIIDKDLVTAPGSPAKGDRYILAGTGGGWSGGAINDIAHCSNAVGPVWVFLVPTEGMIVWVKDENKYYSFNGSNWVDIHSGYAPIDSPTFTTKITTPIIDLTGGQIAFPATAVPSADPNTLDDYEEGTYTITVTPGTSGTVTLNGNYKRHSSIDS